MTMPHDLRAAQIIYDLAGANPPEADELDLCENCRELLPDYAKRFCHKCEDLAGVMDEYRDVRELVTLARAYLDLHRGWGSDFGRCLERFPVLDGDGR